MEQQTLFIIERKKKKKRVYVNHTQQQNKRLSFKRECILSQFEVGEWRQLASTCRCGIPEKRTAGRWHNTVRVIRVKRWGYCVYILHVLVRT